MAATIDSISKIQTGIVLFQKAMTMAEDENSNNKLTVAKASELFSTILPQLKELGKMVNSLAEAVLDIKKISCQDSEEALRQSKINRDNLDDADQRNLVGSMIINIADPDLKKDLGVVDDRSYDDINIDVLSRSLSDRYRVDVRSDDITAAKRITRSGTLRVAFGDTKPGSRYKQLVNAIKSKGANKKGEPLYANFALTTRRNNLLYVLREAWRDKKIEKYFVDD